MRIPGRVKVSAAAEEYFTVCGINNFEYTHPEFLLPVFFFKLFAGFHLGAFGIGE